MDEVLAGSSGAVSCLLRRAAAGTSSVFGTSTVFGASSLCTFGASSLFAFGAFRFGALRDLKHCHRTELI